MNLTDKQRAIYDFVRDYIGRRGVAPSYEEIRRHFRYRSYFSVQKHLKKLDAALLGGWMRRYWKKSRHR